MNTNVVLCGNVCVGTQDMEGESMRQIMTFEKVMEDDGINDYDDLVMYDGKNDVGV